jgi:hypothetical protein
MFDKELLLNSMTKSIGKTTGVMLVLGIVGGAWYMYKPLIKSKKRVKESKESKELKKTKETQTDLVMEEVEQQFLENEDEYKYRDILDRLRS